MGVTKTEIFTEKQNELALQYKSLGHPARIAIIDYLMGVESCICGDIVNEVNLAQPTVSQHLKELKNAKIIKGEIEGNAICYCVDADIIRKIHEYTGTILSRLELDETACC